MKNGGILYILSFLTVLFFDETQVFYLNCEDNDEKSVS